MYKTKYNLNGFNSTELRPLIGRGKAITGCVVIGVVGVYVYKRGYAEFKRWKELKSEAKLNEKYDSEEVTEEIKSEKNPVE